MNKSIKFYTLFIISAILWSCNLIGSNFEEEKEFISKFAQVVKTGNIDSLLVMYPDAKTMGKLSFSFNEETAQFSANPTNDTITIKCDSITLILNKKQDGTMHIVNSKGLFTVPENIKEIAKNTGWYKSELTDVENATALSDTTFLPYLRDQFLEDINSKLKAKVKAGAENYESFTCSFTLVITNNCDIDIPGDAYYIAYSMYGWDCYRMRDVCVKRSSWDGLDVKAHSNATRSLGRFDLEYSPSYSLTLKIKDDYDISKLGFKAKGDEYQKYLESKK